jgi:exosortase F-associated protein
MILWIISKVILMLLPLPSYDSFHLLIGLLFRYVLNTVLSLGLLYTIFRDGTMIKFLLFSTSFLSNFSLFILRHNSFLWIKVISAFLCSDDFLFSLFLWSYSYPLLLSKLNRLIFWEWYKLKSANILKHLKLALF